MFRCSKTATFDTANRCTPAHRKRFPASFQPRHVWLAKCVDAQVSFATVSFDCYIFQSLVADSALFSAFVTRP